MPQNSPSFFSKNKIYPFLLILLYIGLIVLCAPIFLGFFLSSIISPLILLLHKKLHIHYYVLIIGCALLIFGAAGSAIYYLFTHGEQLALQAYDAVQLLFSNVQTSPYLSYITSPLQQLLLQFVSKLIVSIDLFIQYIFDFLLFFIALFFSLVETRRDRYWYFVYVPKSFRATWRQFFDEALQMFGRYFSIELRLVAITTFLLYIGFMLLQFPHPLYKALLLALFDCIPFFGISIVLVPVALYFAATQQLTVACLLLVLLVVTIIVRQICDSLLWASSVKIKTIHTFFISAVSFSIFGLYGIIVSPLLLLVAIKMRMHYGRF